MASFADKLKHCGKLIQEWGDRKVGNTIMKIERLRKEIGLIHDKEDYDSVISVKIA